MSKSATDDKIVQLHSKIDAGQTGSINHNDTVFSIGELARQFEVTTRAIRFYEIKGLLAPRRSGSARLYSRRDRARLQLILRGKNLGFTLEEIREFLDLYDADPSQGVQARHLLGKVEIAIADLEQKQTDIEHTLEELRQIAWQCRDHLGVDE